MSDTLDSNRIRLRTSNLVTGALSLKTSSLNISGGGGGDAGTIDPALSPTSTNAVQNKAIYEALDGKANASHTHTTAQITDWNNATSQFLTSHQSLKTINNQSLVGEGNITIEGGGSSVEVDDELDGTSTNPVENKAITEALAGKQNTLVSGTNIRTINGEPILGSGDITVTEEGVVPTYTVRLKGVATEKTVKNRYTSYSLISDTITSASARPTTTNTNTYNSLTELFTSKQISNPTNPDFILDRVNTNAPYFYIVYYKGTMFTTTPYYFTVDQITGLMTSEEETEYGDFSDYIFSSQEKVYCRGFEGNRDFYVWNGSVLSVTPSTSQTVMYLQGNTMMQGENTVYEIVGDIDLCGDTITPASGVVIKYGGGKIKNGTINGKNGIWIDCPDIVFFENMKFEEMVNTQVFKDTWFADVFYEGSVGGLSHLSLSRDYYITSDSMQVNGVSNANRINRAPHEMLVLYGNNHTVTLPAKMYKRGTTGFQFIKMIYLEVHDLNIKREQEGSSRLTAVFDVNIGIFHNVKSESSSTFSAAYTNTVPTNVYGLFGMYPQLQFYSCDIRVPWFAMEGPFNIIIARDSSFYHTSKDDTSTTMFSVSPCCINDTYLNDSYVDIGRCYIEGGWETPNHGKRLDNGDSSYTYYYTTADKETSTYTNNITYNKVKFKDCELVLPYIGFEQTFSDNAWSDTHSGTTSLAKIEDCIIYTGLAKGRWYTDNLIFRRCRINVMHTNATFCFPFVLHCPTGKLQFLDCVFDSGDYTSKSGRYWPATKEGNPSDAADSKLPHYVLAIAERPSDDFKVVLKNNTFIESQYRNKVDIYCAAPTGGTLADRVECSGNRFSLASPRLMESNRRNSTYAPWSSAYGKVTEDYWAIAPNSDSRSRYILPIFHTAFRGSEDISSSPYSFDACVHDFDYSTSNIYLTTGNNAVPKYYYIYDSLYKTSKKISFE